VKPVLTATEYRRVDQAYPGDLVTAMERAGLAVALAAARHGAAYGKNVVVLAGPGNNGGDGYVAARHLKRRGAAVEVRRLGEPLTSEAIQAAARARGAGVPVADLGPPVDCDLIIDALFGGGVRRGLPPEVGPWIDSAAPVVAVDFPTGLDPDTGKVEDRAFRAVETVTFSSLKTGHVCGSGPDYCGTVSLADIGISGGRPSMWVAEGSDAPRPVRSRTAHKWSAGAVLVVGGSAGMVGAATMASRAALAFGAGSVYLASPRPDLAHTIAPEIPALSFDDVGDRLARFDVVVLGPGLDEDDAAMTRSLVGEASRLVLDAGGLQPGIIESAIEGGTEVIATPHAGEFKRIAGVGQGSFSTRSYAGRTGVTLVSKGSPTTITDGGAPVLVTTGGPELATIGTGDVLAGMIGALWARGLSPMEAAISGAYWHGVAAADLRDRGTVTATLLLDAIGGYAW
jgi:ADP-dependent NAD(P)H-hydrate dehydratase / NAD(P)H-hydrate epimerase